MALIRNSVKIRFAKDEDWQKLANLIHFETYVHRHLDWRPPIECLGQNPFLVIERDHEINAVLASPPELNEATWIRLFAVSSRMDVGRAWRILWPRVHDYLLSIECKYTFVIPLQNWFQRIIQSSNFEHIRDVIMLRCEKDRHTPSKPPDPISLRMMNYDDLPFVQELDAQAFNPEWRNTLEMLEHAFKKASLATVAEIDNNLIGYQISTISSLGGHIARLAVLPDFQGRGSGYALVNDVLTHFQRRGVQQVTVNTQTDNHPSISLYKKAGFTQTKEKYPVYQYIGN